MWRQPWRLAEAPIKQLKSFVDEMATEQARRGQIIEPGLIPTQADIRAMVEVTVWATTIADEGRYPRFSLVFGRPNEGVLSIKDRDVTPKEVAALAPTLVRGLTRIGVHRSKAGGLRIWGLLPGRSTWFEVLGLAPGHVVARIGPWNIGIFRRNDYIPLVLRDPAGGELHGVGRMHFCAVAGKAFSSTHPPWRQAMIGLLLLTMAEAVRNQGNGGTLLVLPSEPTHKANAREWLDLRAGEIEAPVTFEKYFEEYEGQLSKAADPFGELAQIDTFKDYFYFRPTKNPEWFEPPNIVGQLSATDGAVVLTNDADVIGFGAMVRPPLEGKRRIVDEIECCSILRPNEVSKVPVGSLGGARRQAAARFVANNYDTVAITASHDGPVSLAVWGFRAPGEDAMPRVYKDIETLLD